LGTDHFKSYGRNYVSGSVVLLESTGCAFGFGSSNSFKESSFEQQMGVIVPVSGNLTIETNRTLSPLKWHENT
jgi:hypothetical protein